MIEQTPLVVVEWIYLDPGELRASDKVTNSTSLEIMKKRAADKKGIACRFTNHFKVNDKIYLNYIAEDSYVIDLKDIVDRKELVTMITNAHSKFEEEFNKRRFTTAFINYSLAPFDANLVNLDAILPLLLPE